MYKFPEDMKKAYESSPLSFVYYQNIDHKAIRPQYRTEPRGCPCVAQGRYV